MKFFAPILLLGLAASVSSVSFYSLVVDEWEVFKLQHGKQYKSGIEENFRRKIFAENKHNIAIHNKEFYEGKHSYELKMNQYGDLLHHEFRGTMNGIVTNLAAIRKFREENAVTFMEPNDDIAMPAEVDWRTKGAVTPVKNQGQCGSCWAFSTTGALEGQHYRKTGKLVSLSEQNLVDCSTKFGNNGCNGGLMDYAFQYIKQNGGIDTENSYPYEGKDDTCEFKPSGVGADDKGYVDIRAGSEKSLKKALATIGPIAIAIDASHSSFQFYHKGVYYQPDCSSEELDHGVLAVGYGSENGEDYWLVKNSWGPQWGDEGYIRMARNRGNNCGPASSASYPLV